MQELLHFFGHGFCHQLHERTLEAGGLYFAVCARDTGMHLGLVITVLIVCIGYMRSRPRPSGFAPFQVVVCAIILALPMIVDGVSSYLHFRETTNAIRFFTGYGAGAALGLVSACAVTSQMREASERVRVLARPSQLAATLAVTAAASVAFYMLYPFMGIVAPFVALAAFLAMTVGINYVLVSITRRFSPHNPELHPLLKHRILPIAACFVMAIAEIAFLGAVRDLILGGLFDGKTLQELFF
jgi:uncharacterized membrane protein